MLQRIFYPYPNPVITEESGNDQPLISTVDANIDYTYEIPKNKYCTPIKNVYLSIHLYY